jgi:hypothetical protein
MPFRVNLFPLERSEETFTIGIVTRAGRSADAGDHAVLGQRPQIFGVRVLRPAIRMIAPTRVLAFVPSEPFPAPPVVVSP